MTAAPPSPGSDGTASAEVSAEVQHRTAPKWLGPALVVFIVGLNVLGFITNASAPKLLKEHPLTLMTLNPRYRYLVVAAPRVDAIPFYVIGVLRLLFSDPAYFALGWFFGDRAIKYFNDAIGETAVESTRRLFLKASTVMALFAAGPIICVLAGAARIRPKRFFSLDLLGTMIIVALLRLFSKSMEGVITSFLRFNDKNYKWLMIITIATTLIVVARVGRKQVGAARSLGEDLSDD